MVLERLGRIWDSGTPEDVRAARQDIDALAREVTSTPEQVALENFDLINTIAGLPSVRAYLSTHHRIFNIHRGANSRFFADELGVQRAVFVSEGLGQRLVRTETLSRQHVAADHEMVEIFSKLRLESII